MLLAMGDMLYPPLAASCSGKADRDAVLKVIHGTRTEIDALLGAAAAEPDRKDKPPWSLVDG